jgi:hypothetical protein
MGDFIYLGAHEKGQLDACFVADRRFLLLALDEG